MDSSLPFSEELFEKLQDPEVLRRVMEEEGTFQAALGYSDEKMQEMYTKARQLLKDQDVQESADAFTMLTTLNPYVPAYWLGLGMAEHLLEEFEEALNAYRMARLCNPADPISFYHSAACCNALGRFDESVQFLNQCVEICRKAPEHRHWLKDAEQARDRMVSKIGSG